MLISEGGYMKERDRAKGDMRMEILLELVHPLKLSTPQMHRDPVQCLEKSVRKVSPGKRQRKS